MNTVHFQNIKEEILSIFINCKHEIKIAISWFTSFEIWEVVVDLLHKGKKITVVTNNDEINNNSDSFDFNLFISAGGKLFFIKKEYFLHDKFAIVDNKKVLTGSYNYTEQAEKVNIENLVIIENKDIVHKFNSEFTVLLSNSIYVEKFVQIERDYQVNCKFQKLSRSKEYRVTYFNETYKFIEIINESGEKYLLNCEKKFEIGEKLKLVEPFEFDERIKIKNNFLSVQKWIKQPVIIK